MIELIPMTLYFCDRSLFDEPLFRGEVQQRASGLQVDLNQHQAPRAIEGTERERPLHPRHLVVKQLHRID